MFSSKSASKFYDDPTAINLLKAMSISVSIICGHPLKCSNSRLFRRNRDVITLVKCAIVRSVRCQVCRCVEQGCGVDRVFIGIDSDSGVGIFMSSPTPACLEYIALCCSHVEHSYARHLIAGQKLQAGGSSVTYVMTIIAQVYSLTQIHH